MQKTASDQYLKNTVLTATPEQASAALRAIIELASRPPDRLLPPPKERKLSRESQPVPAAR